MNNPKLGASVSLSLDRLHLNFEVVVVHFQPKNPGDGTIAEEVFVEVDNGLISAGQVNGKKSFTALLSELVPLAIEQLSPKKGT